MYKSNKPRLSLSLTPRIRPQNGGMSRDRMNRAQSVLSAVSSVSHVSLMSILRTRSRGSEVTITKKCNSSVSGFGKMINQYKLGVTLGIGSYGKVKSCIDKNNDKTFAVKIIPRSQFKTKVPVESQPKVEEKKEDDPPENQIGIAQEMACLTKMNHMNIIKLQEIIDDPSSKKVYLVMDYC